MKKWILLAVAIVCCVLCQAEGGVKGFRITGKALPGEKVELQWNQNGIVRSVAGSKADSIGNFCLEYFSERTGIFFVTTLTSQKNIMVIMRPGEQMQMDLSGEQILFSKDAAERNRFIQDLQKQRKIWAKKYFAPLTDAVAYRHAADAQYKAFRQYITQNKLEDKEIQGIIETDVKVQYYGGLLKYPFLCQVVTGKVPGLPEDYYSFLKEVDLSSPYWENLGNANSFLRELFAAMEKQGYLFSGKDDYLLKRAERIGRASVKENYLLDEISKVELFGYNQYLGVQIEKIRPLIITPAGQAKLEELIRKYNASRKLNGQFNAGQQAFDFTGTDVTGKQHRLSDYRGQVVVVDVWNTGCKPCIEEIPYLRKLEKQFEGKGVVFISYSLDTDKKIWKQFMVKHEMKGNQWIDTLGFKSALAKQYNVRFIPRFMLFDKSGKIVDVYAPRPSNLRLARWIEEELKK